MQASRANRNEYIIARPACKRITGDPHTYILQQIFHTQIVRQQANSARAAKLTQLVNSGSPQGDLE